MFESITMNFLTQPKVVAAVDIFRALQTAATSLKNNLMIFAAAAAVASIVIGGLFFLFGRRGAENGKMHVGYVLMGGRSYFSSSFYCGFVIWIVWTNTSRIIRK